MRRTLRMGRGPLLAVAVLVASVTVGTGPATRTVAATDDLPSSVPIRPISFDALYVVNGGDGERGSLSVINTETNRLAATIELTNVRWPHHIYLSGDGRRLALAVPGMDLSGGHGGGTHGVMGAVMLLDARTGTTLNARVLSMMNHNATFSPDQREIWTSQMMMDMPGSVLVLDARSLATREQITVQNMPAEVTFPLEGGFGYVANTGSASVSVIDPTSRAVVTTIPVGDGPVGAWQADNGFAYVDNEHAMTVSAIDRRTNTVRYTVDLGFMPGMAQLGPDRLLWVTDSTNGQVVLFFGTNRLGAIPTGAGAHAIAFSGNGRWAYITNQMANTVSVIDVWHHRVVKTIAVGEKPNGMVWRDG
jgi:YVTN family beta-propeller protein